MKNKPLIYLLITAVAAVWGIIFYRIFSASDTGETNFKTLKSSRFVNESLDDFKLKDTFTLALNYRDPFLSDISASNESYTAKAAIVPQALNSRSAPIRPAIDWNFIKYTGYISNRSKKSVIAIMLINGKEYMMREGELFEGVKLVHNSKDSVKVAYQNKIRFITIQ